MCELGERSLNRAYSQITMSTPQERQTENSMRARLDELTARLEAAESSTKKAQEAAKLAEQARAATATQLDKTRKLLEELKEMKLSSTPTESTTTMSMREVGTLRNIKFDDTNWLQWSQETQLILNIQKLWEGVVASPNAQEPGFERRNLLACLLITSSLDHVEVPEAQELRTHDAQIKT